MALLVGDLCGLLDLGAGMILPEDTKMPQGISRQLLNEAISEITLGYGETITFSINCGCPPKDIITKRRTFLGFKTKGYTVEEKDGP